MTSSQRGSRAGARTRRVAGAVLSDLRPLRASPAYRRLFLGNAVAQLGHQMTTIAVAIQVYAITDSSLAVGTVGLFALVPLVAFGLYGGALADALDRRRLALVSTLGAWAVTLVLVAQAAVGSRSVLLLYLCVAAQSGCYAVTGPARQAIIARLLPRDLLPAASALNMAAVNLGVTLGPLLGALAISLVDFTLAYAIDAALFLAALLGLWRLPSMPPGEDSPRPGFRAVVEGLGYLRRSPNLAMTFVLDLCAMVLAQPRALFPALAAKVYGGGATTVGILQAAPAVGALLAFVVSGWVSRVRLHGVAIAAAVVLYGLAVGAMGLTSLLWVAVAFLAMSGAADMVSSAFRNSVLQTAAPDHLRGRLQGVFIVVVAGGPRAGDFLAGGVAETVGERVALVCGGIACVVAVLVALAVQRGFLRYDARDPRP